MSRDPLENLFPFFRGDLQCGGFPPQNVYAGNQIGHTYGDAVAVKSGKSFKQARYFRGTAVGAKNRHPFGIDPRLQHLEQGFFRRSMTDSRQNLDVVHQQQLRIFIRPTQFRRSFRAFLPRKIRILRFHEILEELFGCPVNDRRCGFIRQRIAPNGLEQVRFADSRPPKKKERVHGTFLRIFRYGTAHGERNPIRFAFDKRVKTVIRVKGCEKRLFSFRPFLLFFRSGA